MKCCREMRPGELYVSGKEISLVISFSKRDATAVLLEGGSIHDDVMWRNNETIDKIGLSKPDE